jgi:trehalose/maltose hydrolase-like predicted phosphorylase
MQVALGRRRTESNRDIATPQTLQYESLEEAYEQTCLLKFIQFLGFMMAERARRECIDANEGVEHDKQDFLERKKKAAIARTLSIENRERSCSLPLRGSTQDFDNNDKAVNRSIISQKLKNSNECQKEASLTKKSKSKKPMISKSFIDNGKVKKLKKKSSTQSKKRVISQKNKGSGNKSTEKVLLKKSIIKKVKECPKK